MNAGQAIDAIVIEWGEPETWEDALNVALECQRRIMVDRQNKYGPTNIAQLGIFGVLSRAMADKMARLRGALNGRIVRGEVLLDPIAVGNDAADTFEDGLVDLANYSGPIGLMLSRDWWGLPRSRFHESASSPTRVQSGAAHESVRATHLYRQSQQTTPTPPAENGGNR